MGKKTKRMVVRLNEDTKKKMQKRAKDLDTTLSSLTRQSVLYGGAVKIDYSGFEELAREVNEIGKPFEEMAERYNVLTMDESVDDFDAEKYLESLKELNKELSIIGDKVTDMIQHKKHISIHYLDFDESKKDKD